jgi:PhnB protein
MAVKPIPDNYHSITPYLMAPGASRLIEFLKEAFGAVESERMTSPDGAVRHAEVRIGDSMLMLTDGGGEWKPMPASLYLYVNDADATYKRALAAGATSVMEPVTQFYGDRQGGVKDPSGNIWWIATHVEDVSPEELRKRAEASVRQQQPQG